MSLKPPDNPSRDMLPNSLFPKKITPLRDHNPAELRELAARPQKIVPLPKDASEAHRRKLSGLAQYKGRSKEGNLKSLGNLPRPSKSETTVSQTAPIVPAGMPTPVVPTMMPQIPAMKTLTGKYARRVLSKEEHDLFLETWVEWFTAHAEWDKPEDKDDVLTICMETVLMFRLQAAQQDKPGIDNSDAYNQSFKRKQRARENLTARRVDKVGTKAQGNQTTFNVAILAGQITPEMAAARKQKLLQDKSDELDFLEGTIVEPHQTIAEREEKEEG